MTSTTYVTLDLQSPNIAVVVAGKQNDSMSRVITAQLKDGAVLWTPPEGCAAMIRYAKPDGTAGFYDVLEDGTTPAYTITGSSISITLAEQALTVPGNVFCEINFYTSAEKLTTFSFLLSVEASVLSDSTIISTDYFNVLSARIEALLGATTHPPQIDSVTKNWLIWSEQDGQYEDSGYSSVGQTGPAPVVTATAYEYQNSSSGTVVPSGSWSSTVPTTPPGSFRWTKITTTFDNNTSTTWYSVAYMGNDGQGSPGSATPLMDGVGAAGTATAYAREDHVHPSDSAKLDATFAPVHFSATISSLPLTISDTRILADTITEESRVTDVEFGTPHALASDLSWTTAAGSVTFSGTLYSGGSTTISFEISRCKKQ